MELPSNIIGMSLLITYLEGLLGFFHSRQSNVCYMLVFLDPIGVAKPQEAQGNYLWAEIF